MKKLFQKWGMCCSALLLVLTVTLIMDANVVQAADKTGGFIVMQTPDSDYGFQDLALRSNGAARQSFYNMLENAAEEFCTQNINLTSTVICELDVTDLGLSLDELAETYFVVCYDNPQYYWMSNTFSFYENNGRLIVTFCTFEEYRNFADRDRYETLLEEKMQEYDAVVAGLSSSYDIALAIHDKLIHDVEYAYQPNGITPSDSVYAHSIIGVVDESMSEVVCEGYAKMYQLLLNRYGIGNVLVCGRAKGDAHAWNLVQMDDGNYYYTDVTWDDTNILLNAAGEDVSSYQYFNMPAVDFDVEHTAYTPDKVGIEFLYALPSIGDGYNYTFYAKNDGLISEDEMCNYTDEDIRDGALTTSIAKAITKAYAKGESRVYLYSCGTNNSYMREYGWIISNALEKVIPSLEETINCEYTMTTVADECILEFGKALNKVEAITVYENGVCIGTYATLVSAFADMTNPNADYIVSFDVQTQNHFYLSPLCTEIPKASSITFSGGKQDVGVMFYTTGIELCDDFKITGDVTFDYAQLVSITGDAHLEDATVSLDHYSMLNTDMHTQNTDIIILPTGVQCELGGEITGYCDITVIGCRLTIRESAEINTLFVDANYGEDGTTSAIVDFQGFNYAEEWNYTRINKLYSDVISPMMTSENNHDIVIGEAELTYGDTWYITYSTLRQWDKLPKISVEKLTGADKVRINYSLTTFFSTTTQDGVLAGETVVTTGKSIFNINDGLCFISPAIGLEQITATYMSVDEYGELEITQNVNNFYVNYPCPSHSWDSGKTTSVAACTTQGEKVYTCSNCGKIKTEKTPALGHTPVNGYCTVCGKLGFNDVTEGVYYYDAVEWAVTNNITNGYGSDTIFNPDGTCTRGQIVTFLWRANGSPEPTSMNNPFTDVPSNEYYYKAVLWAVENGITAGYGSDTIFNPDGACTRGQVATFLWRAAGKPAMSGAANPFTDVKAGEFYYDAVLWAVENGITNGYGSSTTFCPDITCTRGQIVTFLYRAMN